MTLETLNNIFYRLQKVVSGVGVAGKHCCCAKCGEGVSLQREVI